MVEGVTEKDLIITLISGGGSALFELPDPEFNLDTIIETTKELTAKGADIYALNKVRKIMSQVKGGKFAELCNPAQMVSLIFSDVLGNDISVIASGPTVLDTPSERVKNILIVSNRDALEAMKIKAIELGFNTNIETDKLAGNAGEVGKRLNLRELKTKACILFGGETTVKIPENHGVGGRNQTMALSTLPYMEADSVLICAASDGWDNTDHAGAIADQEILRKAKELNLNSEEYLERGDSYNFFKKVGGAICTGRLGSNVSDLCILIYK
jgi:glycerate-2-kinase